MRILATALVGSLTLASLQASADRVLGVFAGLGTWQQEVTGVVSSNGEAIDVTDDLDLKDDRGNILYFALEHPVPVLPNFKVQKSDINVVGDGTLARQIEFNGVTFPLSEAISTDR